MDTPPTSTLPRLLKLPAFVRFGIHIDSAPAWRWLALLAVALWPAWWWLGHRLVNGTDDTLGAVALAALAATLWHHRARLRAAPHLGLQISALAGAVLTTALYHQAPDGVLGLIGMASLAAGLIAFLPAHIATAPVLGLSTLALPWLTGVQLFVGQPLQGVWWGLFTACAAALVAGCSNRAFIARLPIIGVLLHMGNILRSTVLVALQTSGVPTPHALQTAVGILVLATVCGGIAATMRATPNHTETRAP